LRFFAQCVAALLFAASSISSAATPAALARFTDGLQGLDGRFVQRVFDGEGTMTEETKGKVALSAPRLFRWEYEQPTPQLIVADGDHIWVYDQDLEQVQVRKQSLEEHQSPLAALIDPQELARQFHVKELPSAEGLDWIELKPRGDDAAFESCRLGFRGDELARMTMADALGQRTEMSFDGWQRNPRFAPDVFAFSPPPGVDVVGEMIDSAVVTPIPD
jgi:outer membrane lipoprotein carrier protein